MTGSGSGGTTDEEIMEAIRDHRAPAVGTSDIAEAVGVSRQAADHRLRQLDEDGLVDTMKVGRSRIWWLTDAGNRYLDKP